MTWVSALSHPIRHGMHYNTAFNLFLMFDAAEAMGRGDLAEVLADAARKLFLDDRDYPLEWELSGSDFLSNALCEMLLLSRVLKKTEFSAWLENFLPVQQDALNFLTYTPEVLDPSDGQLAHLYGLTLSRAWMLRELAPHLDQQAQEFIAEHTPKMLASVEKQLVDGDFMATHWLITYALLAIRADQ
ncbi:multidrug transporter [Corynebacterium pseudodiphtheriticum 090104]|nr:multidrug transporter [Corynebacterium pseudodiphtheriticum 090104]